MNADPTTPPEPNASGTLTLAPGDEARTCRDCSAPFAYTVAEQAYHTEQGWTTSPSRCPACREQAKRKQVLAELVQVLGRRIPAPVLNLPQLIALKGRADVLALIQQMRAYVASPEVAESDPEVAVRRRVEYLVSLLRERLTPEEQAQVLLQPLEGLFAVPPVGRLTVQAVAQQLGETHAPALQQIGRVVRVLPPEQVQALLDQTEQVEAAGGMWLEREQRRRTKGGVFFALAHQALTPEQREVVFPPKAWPKREKRKVQQPAAAAAPAATQSVLAVPAVPNTAPTNQEQGQGAAVVKVTLIGRPGRVIEKTGYVLTSMTGKPAPALPKGLPTPPTTLTVYTVYISAKHWRSVAEALQDEEDVLIAEGYPAYDPELEGMAVFVTGVTTKKLQAAKRQAQQP